MNLSYRCSSYESNPIYLATIECGLTAKYRGITYKTRQAKPAINRPNFQLKYRGVCYQSGVSFNANPTTNNFQLTSAIA